MSEFFKSQYDYIYFFYGLAFFFLAVVCFTLVKSKSSKLPWVLFGFFGFTHCITEWLNIAVISSGDNSIFPALRLGILMISYLFLFEFTLIRFQRGVGRVLRLCIYLSVFILVGLTKRYGWDGIHIALRYFFGIPAGIISALFIYRASRAEPAAKKTLIILSIMLALYTVVSGVNVPKADYMLARRINTGSFYDTFGLPVQFILGVLALFLAMTVWFYSQKLPHIALEPKKYHVRFRPSKWVVMLTLFVLIGLGWIFTNYLDYYAGIQIIRNSKINKNSPLNQLVRELTKLEQAALSMSKSFKIINLFIFHEAKNVEDAVILLNKYKRKFNALDCFLLDSKGAIVASTDGNTAENVIDKSFVSKPYFRQAAAGNTGYYFTFGSTRDERIYYVSNPVKDTQGRIVGVIVIKKNISMKPILQYRLISIVITLFVCILAIVFFIILGKRETLIEFIEKANNELHTVDKMKTDFISIVSHELRTPLTSIKNAVTLLLKGAPHRREIDPKEKELLEIILNNTNRQTRMISDLLDISKIEAGVMDIYAEPVDIVALTNDVIASWQQQAQEKRISLSLLTQKKSAIVFIDSEQTRRVLNNLIGNAIKFTPDNGQVTVNIERMGMEVKITVSDNGIGIPADDIRKLFNKFYRVSDINARQKGGSGLGLVIAKGLVEAQGGRIWVEAEFGNGSSFYFTLPTVKKDIRVQQRMVPVKEEQGVRRILERSQQ